MYIQQNANLARDKIYLKIRLSLNDVYVNVPKRFLRVAERDVSHLSETAGSKAY